MKGSETKVVYWHRELPPIESEFLAEHTVEANSSGRFNYLLYRDSPGSSSPFSQTRTE